MTTQPMDRARALEAFEKLDATLKLGSIGGGKSKYAQGRRDLATLLLPLLNDIEPGLSSDRSGVAIPESLRKALEDLRTKIQFQRIYDHGRECWMINEDGYVALNRALHYLDTANPVQSAPAAPTPASLDDGGKAMTPAQHKGEKG